jgi:hypothetical protein
MLHTQLRVLAILLTGVRARVCTVRAEPNRQRGASVVEWIMIIAITVTIVIAVGAILKATILKGASAISF